MAKRWFHISFSLCSRYHLKILLQSGYVVGTTPYPGCNRHHHYAIPFLGWGIPTNKPSFAKIASRGLDQRYVNIIHKTSSPFGCSSMFFLLGWISLWECWASYIRMSFKWRSSRNSKIFATWDVKHPVISLVKSWQFCVFVTFFRMVSSRDPKTSKQRIKKGHFESPG